MVLLEKTDALWAQLQDAVRLCINRGLYALLDLTGAGLTTPQGQHFTATNLASDASSLHSLRPQLNLHFVFI